MNKIKLNLLKFIKLFTLILISSILGLLLSYISNLIILNLTKEIIFGQFIATGVSNPLFNIDDIKLFLFQNVFDKIPDRMT